MSTSKDVCAEVVFGETSLLRAPGGNEDQLVAARRFIAGVVYKRYEGHEGRFAPRQHPTADQLKNPQIAKHWSLCQTAATDASSDDIGACQHFVISWINSEGDGPSPDDTSIKDPWPIDYKANIKDKYGPFTRTDHGDMYVFKYCGVPLLRDELIA